MLFITLQYPALDFILKILKTCCCDGGAVRQSELGFLRWMKSWFCWTLVAIYMNDTVDAKTLGDPNGLEVALRAPVRVVITSHDGAMWLDSETSEDKCLWKKSMYSCIFKLPSPNSLDNSCQHKGRRLDRCELWKSATFGSIQPAVPLSTWSPLGFALGWRCVHRWQPLLGEPKQPPCVLLPLIREDLNSWIPSWVSVGESTHSWFPFAPHHHAPSGNCVLPVCDFDTYRPCWPRSHPTILHTHSLPQR